MRSLIVLAILCAYSTAMLIPREQRVAGGPMRPNVEFEEIPEDAVQNEDDVSEETTFEEKVDEIVEAADEPKQEQKEDSLVGKPSGYNVKPWKRGQRWMRKHHKLHRKEKKGCSLTELLSDFNEDDRLALYDILKNEELTQTQKDKQIKEYGVETKNEDAIENLLKELVARREQKAAERKTAVDEVTETFEKIEEIKEDADLTKAEKYRKMEVILEEVGADARSMLRVLYGKHGHGGIRKHHFKRRIGRNVHHDRHYPQHHNDHHSGHNSGHHHGRTGHGY